MRYKCLQVSTFIFIEFLKHGCEGIRLISNGLPEDTKFIRAGHDELGSLFLILESQSWPELKEGDPISFMESPQFEKMK